MDPFRNYPVYCGMWMNLWTFINEIWNVYQAKILSSNVSPSEDVKYIDI